MYSLILSSKIDSAKKFKHWVTSEILPAIRHTGTYGISNIEEVVNRVLDEKIEGIINKSVSEAVSETVKVLSPFLTLPAREYTTEVRTICFSKNKQIHMAVIGTFINLFFFGRDFDISTILLHLQDMSLQRTKL